MSQGSSKTSSMKVFDYLSSQYSQLQELNNIKSGAPKTNKKLVYILFLIASFIIAYFMGTMLAHAESMKYYKEQGGPAKKIETISYLNAFEFYEKSNMGSTINETINGGYTCNSNGKTVMPSQDGKSTVVQDQNGTWNLGNGLCRSIEVYADYIYYIDVDNLLYKSEPNGAHPVLVMDAKAKSSQVVGEYVYFVAKDGMGHLQRYNINDKSITDITQAKVDKFVCIADQLLFLTNNKTLKIISRLSDRSIGTAKTVANEISNFGFNGRVVLQKAETLVTLNSRMNKVDTIVEGSISLLGTSFNHIYYDDGLKLCDFRECSRAKTYPLTVWARSSCLFKAKIFWKS